MSRHDLAVKLRALSRSESALTVMSLPVGVNESATSIGHDPGASAPEWAMGSEAGWSTGDAGRIVSFVLGWVGIAAMLAIGPFYLAAGLMAPLWAVVVLVAIWLGLFALAIVLIVRRRPLLILPVPVAALGLWWLVLTLGERFLGWTA